MSHIQKLLELAATLPFDTTCEIDEDMIIETFRPMDVCHQRFNLEEINKRVGIKVIHADTNSDQKYGSILKLIHLDEKPLMMISNSGKWLAVHSIYYFSLDDLKAIRDFFNEHATSLFDENEPGATLVTESMLGEGKWWGGRLTQEEDYPFISYE